MQNTIRFEGEISVGDVGALIKHLTEGAASQKPVALEIVGREGYISIRINGRWIAGAVAS